MKKIIIFLFFLAPILTYGQGKITHPQKNVSKNSKSPIAKQPEIPISTDGNINGHGYVDLGLPSGIKWATMNVGASKPSECGNYYSWGETMVKYNFNQENCNTYNKNFSNICGSDYDVSRLNWGSLWRLPTEKELRELMDLCKWEWTTINGQPGQLITGPNGKKLFLPAAGVINGSNNNNKDKGGAYWSGTSIGNNGAFLLDFDSKYRHVDSYSRQSGISIRPVSN